MAPERAWPWLSIALLGGYLIGSIPFGLVITRALGMGDVRNVGSGNIGATNVLRTGSKGAAAATLALDLGKGWAAVALFSWLWGDLPAQLAGLGAFLGHCFPVWLRFQGGKGVATFLGVVLGFGFWAGLACCGAWLVAAAAFRMSSLAALLMSLSAPVWLWVLGGKGAIWVVVILIIVLWRRHHENIARIIAGDEPKIGKS
ncbi:MAG: glycerol-3-phosphate 1-O-acyltransferase PlsY [Pseudomonadota bacterium]